MKKIDRLLNDESMLIQEIAKGLKRAIKAKKEAGFEFISHQEIDELVDSIIRDEIKK